MLRLLLGIIIGVALSASVYGIVHAYRVALSTPHETAGPMPPDYPGIHAAILEQEERDPPQVVFLGDSITDFWRTVPWVWQEDFGKFHPCNAGIAWDRIQHVQWRIEHGEIDCKPKVIVLLIGTNNIAFERGSPEDVAFNIRFLSRLIHKKSPDSKILIVGLLPRRDEFAGEIPKCNLALKSMADDFSVYTDPGAQLVTKDFADPVHLSPIGLKHLADLLVPEIEQLNR